MKQCSHCPRKTLSSNDVAWGNGWRWFTGTTQDGKPYSDLLCPVCAGNKAIAEQPWDVGCDTCDWAYSNDWDFLPGDEPLETAKEAVLVGREHRCEPEVWVMDPDGNQQSLTNFDRDGNLKKRVES